MNQKSREKIAATNVSRGMFDTLASAKLGIDSDDHAVLLLQSFLFRSVVLLDENQFLYML